MARGAWGGTGSRGGNHLRKNLRKPPPAPVSEARCPECEGALVSELREVGNFIAPVLVCKSCNHQPK